MTGIQVIGVDAVTAKLLKLSTEMQEKVQAEMKASGMRTLADAQRTVPVAWGRLRASGRVTSVGNTVSVEFNAKYARYVEFGRRAGGFPPVQVLADWAYKKGIADKKNAMGVGFVIARKIASKGTKPQPYLRPAFERESVKFAETMKRIVR